MRQYLAHDKIKAFHIELSSHCNAACPMCARNVFGSVANPNLELSHISLKDIQSVFTSKLCSQLKYIMFCGTNGEPMLNPEVFAISEHLIATGVGAIHIFTNGSVRTTKQWHALGKLLNRRDDLVAFSVDGLADTNHLYRRGTNFEKIMANAEAYIASGANARWDFLVFEHNEHQVEQARELASKMGFAEFRVRKTSRFISPENRYLDSFGVFDSTEDLKDLLENEGAEAVFKKLSPSYSLRQPSSKNYQSEAVNKQAKEIEKRFDSYDKYLKETEISCIYREKFQRYYISADFKLWPCCFIPGDLGSKFKENRFEKELRSKVLGRYAKDFNSLREHSLRKITQHPWFADDLVSGWGTDSPETRLSKCARTCGRTFDPVLSQSEDTNLLESAEKQSFGY